MSAAAAACNPATLEKLFCKQCAPLPFVSPRLTFCAPRGGTGGGTLAFDSLLVRPTRTAGYAGGGEVRGGEIDGRVFTGYCEGGDVFDGTASLGLTTVEYK